MTCHLDLYVAGSDGAMARAISNLRRQTAELGESVCRVRIHDIEREPQIALEAGVVATPMLVRSSPRPRRILVGDLSDAEALRSVLIGTENIPEGET